jgi:hypothetical protein
LATGVKGELATEAEDVDIRKKLPRKREKRGRGVRTPECRRALRLASEAFAFGFLQLFVRIWQLRS